MGSRFLSECGGSTPLWFAPAQRGDGDTQFRAHRAAPTQSGVEPPHSEIAPPNCVSLYLGLLVVVGLFACGEIAFAQSEQRDSLGDPLPPGAVQHLGTLRLRCSPNDFCYLPDGRVILALGASLEIRDMEHGQRIETQKASDSGIVSIELRRDAKALLMMNSAGRVIEWDLEQKKQLHRWQTGQRGAQYACYSPDAKRVLTTGHLPPTIKEWDLATGKELKAITGNMAYFQKAIYADGKTAIVGGGYETILAHYDLTTGQLLKEWSADYCVYDMALSADGKRLLAGTRHMATEWQPDGYKRLRDFKGHAGGAVTSQAYCPNPDELLTGSRDGSIRRWNRLTGQILVHWFPHTSHVTNMKVSPDGKWALSCGGGFVTETSLETGQPRLKWQRHTASVEAVAFLPSGRLVVSGSADATLRIWDVASGKTVRLIEGAKMGAYSVAASPDGRKVAAGCKDGIVREFDAADGKVLRELKGHLGYVRSVVYAPDGSRLFSSADDGSIRAWPLDKAQAEAKLEGHRGGVLSIAISPDGTRVLSAGRDGTVRLWDAATARLLRTCEGHRGWVECAAFVADGAQALTAGRDGRVLRWDLKTGKVTAEMQHGAWIHALACPPDGKRACSAGDAQATGIVCWDLQTNQKQRAFVGHQGPVTALAFSPDGTRLVSASQDGTLLVWQVEAAEPQPNKRH